MKGIICKKGERVSGMKWILAKLCGIIGAAMSLLSVGLVFLSLFMIVGALTGILDFDARGLFFGGWWLSILVSVFSVPFYFGDMIYSIVKAIKGVQRPFHIVVSVVLFFSIFIFIVTSSMVSYLGCIIWSSFSVGLVIMQVFSTMLARRYSKYFF